MKKIKHLLPASVLLVCSMGTLAAFTACGTQSYTISFDSDGGTVIQSISVDKGTKATEPDQPTKVGYTFLGWYLNDELYTFGDATTVTSDITLKAKWEVKYVNVTFNYNDGATQSVTTDVQEGATVSAPATEPTRYGYTFSGWYQDSTLYSFSSAVMDNITLTANWQTKNFNVTYNYNDGTTENAVTPVQEGQVATEPTAPTRVGYNFLGWYADETAYDFTSSVTADVTLTAKWDVMMLSTITLNTANVKTAYSIGDTFSAEGLVASVVTYDQQNAEKTYTVDLTDANLQVDSSNVNMNKEGTYTVYVGYKVGNITRYSNYNITVTSQISGIHGIELVKEVTSYNVAVGDEEAAKINLSDLKVYSANEDGTLGNEITANITYTYYVEDVAVTADQLTTENARKFQIWASVPYVVGNETYYMTDFVVVTVVGNTIDSLTFQSGTTSQEQGYTDKISSSWKFTAKYSLTGDDVIDLSTATVGTGAGQYTLSNFALYKAGVGEATLTYYYKVGSEILNVTCKVPYEVETSTVNATYSAVLDPVGATNNTLDREGAIEVKGSYADGDEIVPFMVYAKGDISVAKENKAGVTDSTKLYDRLQFGTTKGITVYLAGETTITFYARYGSGSGDGAAFVAKQGETVVVQSADIPFDKDHYRVVTLTLKAGAYDIVSSTGSLNVFLIEISGQIKGSKTIKADIDSLDADTYTATTAIGTDNVFSIVASSSNTVKVEAGNITIGGKTFSKIINLGGSRKGDGRSVAVTITEEMIASGSCTLTVYAYHGGAGVVRTLGVYATGKTGSNYLMKQDIESTGTIATYTFTTAGTYYIGSQSGGINIASMSISYELASTSANGEAE